jgi:hypothetical protein
MGGRIRAPARAKRAINDYHAEGQGKTGPAKDKGNGDVSPISEGHSRYPSAAMPSRLCQSCSENTCKPRVSRNPTD